MHRLALLVMLAACGVEVSGSHKQQPNPNPTQGDNADAGTTTITPPDDAGTSTTEPDAAVQQTGARDFLHEAGVQQCDEAYTCKSSYPGTSTQFKTDWGTSKSNCYDVLDAYYEVTAVQTEVDAGKSVFDPTSAASCLAGITFGSCSTFWQNGAVFPSVCDNVFTGTVPKGSPCVVDEDCQGALACGTHNTCVTTTN
jgi:hypothetical protein